MATPIIQLSLNVTNDVSQKDLTNSLDEEDEEESIFVEELPSESKNTNSETKLLSNEPGSIRFPVLQKEIINDEINNLAAATVTSKMRQFWVNLIEQQSRTPTYGMSPSGRELTQSPPKERAVSPNSPV